MKIGISLPRHIRQFLRAIKTKCCGEGKAIDKAMINSMHILLALLTYTLLGNDILIHLMLWYFDIQRCRDTSDKLDILLLACSWQCVKTRDTGLSAH